MKKESKNIWFMVGTLIMVAINMVAFFNPTNFSMTDVLSVTIIVMISTLVIVVSFGLASGSG